MKYFEYLNARENDIKSKLDILICQLQIEIVGSGYIDCIVQRSSLEPFVESLSALGIAISEVSWWCNVLDSKNGCPHGMGGPTSKYNKGWYSELQNEMISLSEKSMELLLESHDSNLIRNSNREMRLKIEEILKVPFLYTPTEYIEENRCVLPAIWLLVPDDWCSDFSEV